MSIEHMVFSSTHIKTNNNKKKWKIIFHIFPSFTQWLTITAAAAPPPATTRATASGRQNLVLSICLFLPLALSFYWRLLSDSMPKIQTKKTRQSILNTFWHLNAAKVKFLIFSMMRMCCGRWKSIACGSILIFFRSSMGFFYSFHFSVTFDAATADVSVPLTIHWNLTRMIKGKKKCVPSFIAQKMCRWICNWIWSVRGIWGSEWANKNKHYGLLLVAQIIDSCSPGLLLAKTNCVHLFKYWIVQNMSSMWAKYSRRNIMMMMCKFAEMQIW